jgi:hypothetical protein
VINANSLIRQYLLTQSTVTNLLGTNKDGSIYAAPDLPEHYDAAKGPCIQLFRTGGMSHPEIPELVEPIVHIRVWADQQKYKLASDVYGAVHDVLHGVNEITLSSGTIISAIEATGPTELTDPDSSWVMVNSSYQVMARPN